MEAKILEKLKRQRGKNLQVTDLTLIAKAKTLASIITDDEILAKIDFISEIESMQGNIGHVAKTVKEETEKLLKVEKTPEQIAADLLAEKTRKEAEEKANKEKGISPELAAVMEQNKEIMETLKVMSGEKITKTRSELLNNVLADAPEALKAQTLANFKQMNFADDAAFETFKEATKTNVDSMVQFGKEQGVNFGAPKPEVRKPEADNLNPVMKAAFDAQDVIRKSEAK